MRDRTRRILDIFKITLLILVFMLVFSYMVWYLFKSAQPDRTQETAPAAATAPVSDAGSAYIPSADESETSAVSDESSAVKADDSQKSREQVIEETPDALSAQQEPAFSQSGEELYVWGDEGSDDLSAAEASSAAETIAADDAVAAAENDTPSVPSQPEFASPAHAYVPEIIITGSDEPVYDDDFFASFFVQGQDTLRYDDGSYYFMYSIDGEAMGNLEIVFQGDERLLNASELRLYLGQLLTGEAYDLLLGPSVPDYVPVSWFEENGVRVTYDEVGFTIDMSFSVDAMPERVISLASGSSWLRRNYALSGAVQLEPDFFSWRTGYNLYSNLSWDFEDDLFSWNVNLNVSNYLSFGPVALDFFYNLGFSNGEFSFNWNSYRFFYDFVDEGIRLSWGNVYGFSGQSQEGTPVGIQFEKSYSYGDITSPYNSHREYITVTEDSYLQIVRNGRVIYTNNNLRPGNYRIQDFTLETGVNDVEVIVTPKRYMDEAGDQSIDWSDSEDRNRYSSVSHIQSFDMAYDSQLLAKGETLFGGSVSIARVQLDPDQKSEAAGLALRVSPQYYYDYRLDNIALTWFQDVGLTDEMTLMSDYALQLNGYNDSTRVYDFSLSTNMSLRRAWLLGTTTVNGSMKLEDGATPDVSARLDHRFLFDWTVLRGLSTSFLWTNNGSDEDSMSMTVSFSGSLGFLRYSTSGTMMVEEYDFSLPSWRVSSSFSVSPMRNLSISGGINFSQRIGSANENVEVGGYLSASFSFGGRVSGSYSTSFDGSHNLSMNASVTNRDSLNASLSGFRFNDTQNHSLSGGWFHSGDLFSLSVRAGAYNRYNNLSLTTSFSTASYFSGGVFGIGRSVRDSFVLIRPKGALSGAQVQVARSNSGSAQDLRSVFGTSVYSSLSGWQRNNLVVYVTGDDAFADTQTFAYELNPRNRSGYSLKITVPQEYTVTGVIEFDGVIQNTFSSPVYRIERAEDGSVTLVDDMSLYLFADQDGRFIISGVQPGDYLFDVWYDDAWWAATFTVTANESDEIRVIDYGVIDFTEGNESFRKYERDFDGNLVDQVPSYLEPYSGVMDLKPVRQIDSATFWNELFPPVSEEEIYQDFVL